jgi:hypothetical protein
MIVIAVMQMAKFMDDDDDVVNDLRGSHHCLPVKTDGSIAAA